MASGKVFLAVFIVLLGMNLILVASQRLYPFHDLPAHLAASTIYRYQHDPGNRFGEYYTTDVFLRPNVFHLLFSGLRVFPSVEFGNRIFYLLYVLLLPVSVLLLIRRAGGNSWFSLLSFAFVFNLNVSRGFAGFTFGIPLALLMLYAFLRSLDSRRLRDRIAVAGLLVALFFVHAMAAVFALFVFWLCCAVIYRYSLRRVLREWAFGVPALALLVWWGLSQSGEGSGTLGHLLDYYRQDYVAGLGKRAGLLYFDNYHLYEGNPGVGVGLVFSLFVIVALVVGMVGWRRRSSGLLSDTRRIALFLFAGSALLGCLALPEQMPEKDVWLIYERFSSFFLIGIAVIAGTLCHHRLASWKATAICTVCLLHFFLWSGYFRDFAKENSGFTRDLFPQDSANKKLAGVVYDFRFRGQPMYIHFPNYFITWTHGIAVTRLVDYRLGSIGRKVSHDLLPRYRERWSRGRRYDGRYHGMDLILVRAAQGLASAAAEGLTLRREAKNWYLYEQPAGRSLPPD